MWKEPSAGIAAASEAITASEAIAAGSADGAAGSAPPSRQPTAAVVATVEPGSIGEELGFQPGDRLLRINGVAPRDLIDLQVLHQGEESKTV